MINSFNGQYRWLSNFWPVLINMDSALYPSVEHAYQAAKTLDLLDRMQLQSQLLSPEEAKRFGRTLEIRKNWEEIKVGVMRDLLRAKFKNPELREKLIRTLEHELIEGNTWGDTFWGICNGIGENHLGRLLMEIRIEVAKNGS